MASGDSLIAFFAWDGSPPGVSGATFGTIQGTSTYNEFFPVANFDDTALEALDFMGIMPQHYAGGGLTCTVVFAHANNSSGPTWELAFRRINDDAEDLDTTAHTYVYNTVAAGVPSVVGEVGYDDVTFTDGADMDSLAAGELFNLRVRRDPATGGAGDARLLSIHVKET
jgi:hypothetical protein